VALVWPGPAAPRPIAEALDWTTDARRAVEAAEEARQQRRERADSLARLRIAAQARLEAQRRDLARALDAAENARREAQAAIEEAQRALSEIDERYALLLSDLSERETCPLERYDMSALGHLREGVREQLAVRSDVDAELRRARLAERDAAEQWALLRAEEVEIENASQEIGLREEDEDRRCELMADAAADSASTAQRAYENACLQLFTAYVEHASERLRASGPVPPLPPLTSLRAPRSP
jgi:chromosome segregation ATPase